MYVYSNGKNEDSLLLVDDDLYVINGAWQLKKKGDVFLHPLTGDPIDIHLIGYIDYDGDYNTTLARFKDGEGTHLLEKQQSVVEEIVNDFCKKKYYGINCSCIKCKR